MSVSYTHLDYSILEQLNIRYDVAQGSGDDEVLQFAPVIIVRFSNETKTEQVSFSIDYSLSLIHISFLLKFHILRFAAGRLIVLLCLPSSCQNGVKKSPHLFGCELDSFQIRPCLFFQ